MRVIRSVMFVSALMMFAVAAPSATTALAAVGDLTQPAGNLGCMEDNPSQVGDPCRAATFGLGLDGAKYVQTYGTNIYVMSGYGIEVLQKDAADPGLQDLQCLDGDGSDVGSNPSCATEPMMAGSNFDSGSLRASPDGKWVFVDAYTGSSAGNELIVFSRDAQTGDLSEAHCYSANGLNANGQSLCTDLESANVNYDAGLHLALSPNGKFLFAGDGQAITVFHINDSTGALTVASCASEPDVSGCPDTLPAGTNSNAAEMVISPDNKFLYFSSPAGPDVQWLSINQSTGELTNTGTTNSQDCIEDVSAFGRDGCVSSMRGMVSMMGSLAISPDSSGKYVYALTGGEGGAGGVAVLARNSTTGVLTQVAGAAGCATSDGTDDENSSAETGGPQACQQDPGMEQAESLVASPDGQNLYVMTGYEGNESMIELSADASTGVLSEDANVFDDCYTSNIREDAEPFCTGYNAMDGISSGLHGEATVALSSDGSAVYVTSAADSGLAIFQRQTPPTYMVVASATPTAGGSVSAQSGSSGADCGSESCSVFAGSVVQLSATANAGYRFTGWSGGSCSGTTVPCLVANVQASETDIANFAQRFTVTGAVGNAGGGTVTAADNSNNAPACAGDSCTVDSGDTVTLTVSPTAGHKFTGWSGGSCSGSKNPCVIQNVAQNETDTATFAVIPRYTVSSVVSGSQFNTVTASSSQQDASCSNGSCTVNAGDTVTLTANDAPGFRLTGWSGGRCSGTANACIITNVQASETDTATFKPGYTVKATLSQTDEHAGNRVSASDSAAGANCAAGVCGVNPGDTVTLTATAAAGYMFSGWSGGSCTGTVNPCVIKNVRANETDTAAFTPTGAVISGTVTNFAGYGPGEQPPLLSSYTGVDVQIVENSTKMVVAGPVATDSNGNYSLVVPNADCDGTGSNPCNVEVYRNSANHLSDIQVLRLSARDQSKTVNLVFGELGFFAVRGQVQGPLDIVETPVKTELSLVETVKSGGNHYTQKTLYNSTTDLCKATSGECGVGSYLLAPRLTPNEETALTDGGGRVELSERSGNLWIPIDSQPISAKPINPTTSDTESVQALQSVDPVPSTNQHHMVVGRVETLTPYAPTLTPPSPTPLAPNGGVVKVTATPVSRLTGSNETGTANNQSIYEVGNLTDSSSGSVAYSIQVSQTGASTGGPQIFLLPRIDPFGFLLNDPSVADFSPWFKPGFVPLTGEIKPPTDGKSVKTELVVTGKSGQKTLYDSLTSGLCKSHGSDGPCSVGFYLIEVPAQQTLDADAFNVVLNEQNSSGKWVQIQSVTVSKGEPNIAGSDKNVPVLQAVDPAPAS